MSIPSYERLRSDLGRTYLLGCGEWITPVPAEVLAVRPGPAADDQHRSYTAVLGLPAGVDLPQVTCSVSAPETRWPLLLLTPLAPDGQGRHRMQMVFHTRITAAPAALPAGG